MHLSARAIAEMKGQEKTHFLNDAAVRINRSLGDAVGLQNIGVHMISVQPGHYSTEYHLHHYEEECIYVLAGEGIAMIGDDTVAIAPGDFIGFPINGVAHVMQATGNQPLVCLVIGQRLEQDVTDYPKRGKRLFRNSGEWNLVDHSHIERR